MKKSKVNKTWHGSNSPYGSGDYYGTGIKQKVGRVRQDFLDNQPISSKKIGKSPKSLV